MRAQRQGALAVLPGLVKQVAIRRPLRLVHQAELQQLL